MDRQKILIVDDESAMRQMLSDLLSDIGCDLFLAKDGEEAFALAMQEKPDVILLDIMMPEMDGYEMCRQLRMRSEISSIPVIMITGNDTAESVAEGIKAGAEAVLYKPFDVSELKLRVKTILQLNRYRLLATERSQFRWVVEQSSSGYVTINKDDIVTYLNPHAKKIFNVGDYDYPVDSKNIFDLIGNAFRQVPEPAWRNWPNINDNVFLVRPETEDEKALWLKVDFVPNEGVPSGQHIMHFADVTEDIFMFQSMWQFEHMVAHKLRTPLMGIMNSIDLLDSRKEVFTEEDAACVTDANKSAQQLHKSITGILSHIGSRTKQIEGSRTQVKALNKLIKDASEKFESVSVTVDCDSALNEKVVKVNEENFSHILHELFDNSLKFHPDNKSNISIAVTAGDESGICVTVTDDGRNLSDEKLCKLVVPFYQAEKHFTGEVPGMGLGLSMISSTLASIGGSCRVENRKDIPGLVVRLDFPTD